MAPAPLRIPVRAARRMALLAQRLGGPGPPARRRPEPAEILELAEALGCLQLDPTSAVARSHLLVLRARLGPVDPATVDAVAYEDRGLFEYWAHEASLVCTADLPIHRWAMRGWPVRDSPGARRATAWLEANAAFREYVLARLEAEGPLPAAAIENRAAVPHHSSGWTPAERSVGLMLDLLWLRGEVGVGRRDGGRRLWDLMERCLPPAARDAEPLGAREASRRAALRALRALGVARAPHIRDHFTRRRYPELPAVLEELRAQGRIEPVAVEGLGDDWWVHAEDAERLRALATGEHAWRGRTAILSPFDNLLCDRARTEALFAFSHRLEIYVPRAKRRWGYFVLPILHGDRLVGRADLLADTRAGVLRVPALYAEPRAPRGAGRAIRRELGRLAAWRGLEDVVLEGPVPEPWRGDL